MPMLRGVLPHSMGLVLVDSNPMAMATLLPL